MKFKLESILLLFCLISMTTLMGQVNNEISSEPFPTQSTTTLKVYPNPTLNYFRVQSNKEIYKIEIYTVLGKKVKEFTQISKHEIFQINDLNRGMYLVSIVDANNKVIKTVRLSKQ